MRRQRDKKIIVIFQIMVLAFFSAKCFALSDAIGDPTVPPSGIRSGLTRTPSPVGTGSNPAATSNVGRLGLEGFVPYRTTTQFGAPLLRSQDTSLFQRRSAPVSSTRLQPTPQPYYPPSRTASSTVTRDTGTALSYSGIRSSKIIGESAMMEMPKVEKRVQIPAVSPLYDYDRTRPLSYEPTDLERVITYDRIREKTKKELSAALQKASEGMHKTDDEDQPSRQPSPSTNLISKPAEPAERFEPIEPVQPGQQPMVKTKESVYGQMLRQIEEISQGMEVQPEQQQETSPQEEPEKSEEKEPVDLRSELSEIEKETAEAVIGVHRSFATELKDKFNYYMRMAEKFLEQGKYYRATDAYTLASVYRPQDPLAYAGRSHALFASGEYMSSAYFLARAIDIFPQYVNFKVDLNAMIPDKDRLESRIEDIKQWIDKAESAELSFLLAYIYYQLDKSILATEAIEFAQEEMPDSTAVKALKQAIEKKQ